jgi:hypothetical protein
MSANFSFYIFANSPVYCFTNVYGHKSHPPQVSKHRALPTAACRDYRPVRAVHGAQVPDGARGATGRIPPRRTPIHPVAPRPPRRQRPPNPGLPRRAPACLIAPRPASSRPGLPRRAPASRAPVGSPRAQLCAPYCSRTAPWFRCAMRDGRHSGMALTCSHSLVPVHNARSGQSLRGTCCCGPFNGSAPRCATAITAHHRDQGRVPYYLEQKPHFFMSRVLSFPRVWVSRDSRSDRNPHQFRLSFELTDAASPLNIFPSCRLFFP